MTTTQITVRLPVDIVTFVDTLVRNGEAPSRTAVLAEALVADRRRRQIAREKAILQACGGDPYPDLRGITEVAHRARPDMD